MDRIKGKRATQRALHTRLRNEASELIQSSQFSAPVLRVLHDRLKNCNDRLRVLNEQLEGLLTDEQAAEDYLSVLEYEDNAAATLSLLSYHIEQLPPETTVDRNLPIPNDDGFEKSASRNRSIGDASRLPKLDLVHFNGGVLQWQPFWDVFKYAAHTNTALMNVERFLYLKSLLVGPAAKALEGIQVIDSSYADAMEILTDRFGNARNIKQKYLENLRTLKSIRCPTDVTTMRDLLDIVTINVTGLKAVVQSQLSDAVMLLENMTKVIPNDIVVEHCERQSSSERPNETHSSEIELQQLLDHLRLEVEDREKAAQHESTVRDTPKGRLDRRPIVAPTTSVLHSDSKMTAKNAKTASQSRMRPPRPRKNENAGASRVNEAKTRKPRKLFKRGCSRTSWKTRHNGSLCQRKPIIENTSSPKATRSETRAWHKHQKHRWKSRRRKKPGLSQTE